MYDTHYYRNMFMTITEIQVMGNGTLSTHTLRKTINIQIRPE